MDTVVDLLEKLMILHLKQWHLEEVAHESPDDSVVANAKRKIDVLNKQRHEIKNQIKSLLGGSEWEEIKLY